MLKYLIGCERIFLRSATAWRLGFGKKNIGISQISIVIVTEVTNLTLFLYTCRDVLKLIWSSTRMGSVSELSN